jgi:cyanate permease
MSPSRSARYLLLALGSLGYLSLMFAWFSLPAFLPTLIEALGLSDAQAGLLAGAVPLVYIPVALWSGLLIDRVGARRAIGAGLLIVGTAHLARGFATDFPTMLAATLLLGVGGTGLTFGLPKLVSELFVPARAGSLSAVYVVGSYLGTAAAFGIARPLLGPALGWQTTFRYSGLAVIGVGLLWLLAAWAIESTPASQTESSMLADLRTVLASREMKLLVVIGTMYLLLVHGLQGWLTTMLQRQGIAPTRAAQVTTLLVLAQIAGALLIPTLADRWRRRREALVAAGTLCAVAVALLWVGSLPAIVLVVAAVGIGVGGLSPLVRSLPVEFDGVGPTLTATAVGLIFAIGEAGGFLGPVAVGALADLTGSFRPGVVLFGAAGVVVVLAGAGMHVDG